MKGRLGSHRFRRRLGWTLGGLTFLGVIVAGAIVIGNTGRTNATPIDRSKRAWVYHEPVKATLTAADRRELFAAASRFIQTAVARKHLDSAWEMLGPEMKAGQTRRSWDTGTNNVVPFPAVGIANWGIDYAYENDVALDLGVIGARSSDWAGKTFTIEFKRYPSHPNEWLVAAWVPKGVGGAGQIKSVASAPPPLPPKATVSGKWLLAPLGVLAALLATLGIWGIRSGVRQRRAARRYSKLLSS
jgi:hypothetical protein